MEILSKKSNWEATIDLTEILETTTIIIIVWKLRVKVSLSLRTTSYTHAHRREEFAYNIEPRSRAFASVNRVEAKIAERGRGWLPRMHVYRIFVRARIVLESCIRSVEIETWRTKLNAIGVHVRNRVNRWKFELRGSRVAFPNSHL